MNERLDYLFIVPTLNEASTIGRSLPILLEYFTARWEKRGTRWHVVVADSNSTDGTRAVVARVAARYPGRLSSLAIPTPGRGRALKETAGRFDARIYCYLDADIPIPPECIPRLLAGIERGEADLVGGKRTDGKRNAARRMLTAGFKTLTAFFFGLRFSDAQCGVKAWHERAKPLLASCREEGYFLDTEFLVRAKAAGLAIQEVSVPWIERRFPERRSKTHPIRDSLRAFRALGALFKDMHSRLATLVTHGAALTLFAGLSLLYTWPLALRLRTELVGIQGDSNQLLWYFWWLRKYVVHDWSLLFWSNHIFAPIGFYPANALWTPLTALGHMLLAPFTGDVAAYNLLVLSHVTLAAFGAYFLGRYLTRTGTGGIIAGIVFGYSSFVNVRILNHINVLAIEFIPLLILAWLHFLDSRGAYRDACFVALTLFLVTASDYVNALFAILIMGAILMVKHREKLFEFSFLGKLALTALLYGIAVFPLLFILTSMPRMGIYPYEMFSAYPSDLLSFFLPAPAFAVGGSFSARLFNVQCGPGSNVWECTSYLGWIELAFLAAGFFLWKKVPGLKFFYALFAVSLVLSLGPSLHVGGRALPIPLPYRLLYYVPPFFLTRTPNRLNVFTILFLAIIVAKLVVFARAKLASRAPGARPRIRTECFIAALALLIFLEKLTVPYPSFALAQSNLLSALSRDASFTTILNLPADSLSLMGLHNSDQMLHEKRIVFGYVHDQSMRKNAHAFLDVLELSIPLRCTTDETYFEKYTVHPDALRAELKRTAREAGIGYIVLNKDIAAEETCRAFRTFFKEQYLRDVRRTEDAHYLLVNVNDL